jgi:hypothetical protein
VRAVIVVHGIHAVQEQVNIHSIRNAPLIKIGPAAKVMRLMVRARAAAIKLLS